MLILIIIILHSILISYCVKFLQWGNSYSMQFTYMPILANAVTDLCPPLGHRFEVSHSYFRLDKI